MRKFPMRRVSDRIRLLADELWARGDKDDSTRLHNAARQLEEKRLPWLHRGRA